MTDQKTATFYLPSNLLQLGRKRENAFLAALTRVLEHNDYLIEWIEEGPEAVLHIAKNEGYSFVYKQETTGPHMLCIREAYRRPFWQIERQKARWQSALSRANFSEPDVDRQAINQFYRFWQGRLFESSQYNIKKTGYIFAPLQGKLTVQRSFQSLSPLDMLEELVAEFPDHAIRTSLHPGESYSPEELEALEALCSKHQRLFLSTRPANELLAGCDLVATENSSVAFFGYFFRKPALLYAASDFHHIAASRYRQKPENALRKARQLMKRSPDFAAYIYWFWQLNCINAGVGDVDQRIVEALQRADWPIG